MTQVEILRQLCDGKWYTTKEIHKVGKNSHLNLMWKRGELCRRIVFVPVPIMYYNKQRGWRFAKVIQYRMHPDWIPVCRRRFGYE